MQFVAENGSRGIVSLLVFVVDRRAGKAEEDGLGEGILDGQEHFPEGVSVAFVDNENQTLLPYHVNGVFVLYLFLFDVAHLLNGGNDEHFVLVVAFQLLY